MPRNFVEHSLITAEADPAIDFYCALFDWQRAATGNDGGDRVMLESAGETVCEVVAHGEGNDFPNRWFAFVDTDELETPGSRALELRGRLLLDRASMPWGRTVSVIEGPGGEAIGLVRRDSRNAPDTTTGGQPAPNTFCWHELYTEHSKRDALFYNAVMGWELLAESAADPRAHLGWLFTSNQEQIARIRFLPEKGKTRAFWLSFVNVDDLQGTANRCVRLGGELLATPTEQDGREPFILLSDPAGGVFAIKE